MNVEQANTTIMDLNNRVSDLIIQVQVLEGFRGMYEIALRREERMVKALTRIATGAVTQGQDMMDVARLALKETK